MTAVLTTDAAPARTTTRVWGSDRPQGRISSITGGSTDPVRDYLQQIGKIPLLTAEDEIELAKSIEVGVFAREKLESEDLPDDVARELRMLVHEGSLAYSRFVRSNLKLVVNIAKRFVGKGVPFMDLIQEGNIGLDRAVKKFDYQQGYKFSTYATWWIKQSINRGVADSARLIRVPVHASEKVAFVRKTVREMEVVLGRRPTVLELANETGLTPEQVQNFLDADREPVSINALVGEEGDVEFGELIEDEGGAPVIDIVEAGIRHDMLRKKLRDLPERYAEVLSMRFGLTNEAPMTYERIGSLMGVSRERIRQIEQRALIKLRCPDLKG